jgi:nucleoside-diphosphate-sugar epimerase
LFGSGDRFLEGRGHVIISLLEKAAKNVDTDTSLEVWGDGTASRDCLSTKTASRLMIELIDKQAGVVNVASGQEIYIKEIAIEIVKEFGLIKGVEFIGINQGITRRVCSIEKLSGLVDSANEINSKDELLLEIKAFRKSILAK